MKGGAEEPVAYALLDLIHAFELETHGPARAGWTHTARDVSIDEHLEARAKLFIYVMFEAASTEQRFKQTSEAAEHILSFSIQASDSSIQFIAEVMRYQLRFSRASWARPARVSL